MDRAALKKSLLELLEKETWEKHDDLDEQTDLRQGLNLDSVDMVSLVLEIQNTYQIEIENRELETVTRVGDLLDLLEQKLGNGPQRKAA